MKLAGLLVMPAGFFLSIAALVLFPQSRAAARAGFIHCALAIEVLGLVVAARGHLDAQDLEARDLEARNKTGWGKNRA